MIILSKNQQHSALKSIVSKILVMVLALIFILYNQFHIALAVYGVAMMLPVMTFLGNSTV